VNETFDEPPDENEAFENLDEALDAVDAERGYSGGPEGERDLGSDLVVDRFELEEADADLDDPEQISLLPGAMDDPDGAGTRIAALETEDEEDEEDVGTDAEADERDGWLDDDEVDAASDLRDLDLLDVDPSDLEALPDEGSGG
jgi:hypothetical protein